MKLSDASSQICDSYSMVFPDFLSNIPFKDMFKYVCMFWVFICLSFFFLGRGLWFLLCFGLRSVLMQLSFFCLKWRVFSINADSYTEVLQADKKCYCFQIIVLPLGKMYSDLLFYYCIY